MQPQSHRVSRIHQSTRLLLAAAAVTVAQLALSTASTHAANKTWDGGGADDFLSTAANWDLDTLPAVGDAVFFAGSTRTSPVASVPVQYLNLTFNAGAAPFTLGGTGTITTGASPATAGNITNNSTNLETFNAPVAIYGGTIAATAGPLLFSGPINLGNGGVASGNTVTVTGPFNTTFAGAITSAYAASSSSSPASLNKTATGSLVVTSDNPSFAGRVFISGGTVRIGTANALGSGGGDIITAASSGSTGLGTLELTGDITLTKNVQTRPRQDATINEPSIRNVSGNNTVSTITTSTGGSRFNYESAAGNLTINSWNTTASGGQRTLRLIGAGNGQINNWTPVAGNVASVIKEGTGTWTLGAGMNSADGSFGSLTVSAGNLVLAPGLGAKVTGIPSVTTVASVVPNVTIANGATLTVQASNGVDGEVGNAPTPGTLTVATGGTLDASTFTQYNLQAAQTLIGGGTFKAGTLGAFGDNAIHIGDSTSPTAVGTLSVQGNLSLSNQFSSSTGGLYFNLGNTTTPGAGVNDLISINGDLQIDESNGPINVRLTPLPSGVVTGTYRLIDFTSGTTPNPADFNLLGFTAGQTRQTATIVTAPGQVNLSIVGNPANLVWKGDGSANVWDSATTPNFLNTGTNAPDKFYPFDNATFDDTSANNTVNLTGSLVLGTATVNTTGTYTFAGSGTLDGGGSLTKSGPGTLVVANTGTNTYTGPTTINAGTLQVGIGGAEGSLGTGAVVDNGSLVINKGADVTLAGISGSGSLVKQGTGNLILASASTYTGPTSVQAGSVFASNGAAFGDPAAGTTVSPGATIYFLSPAATYNEPFSVSGDGVSTTGSLRAGGAVTNTLAGPVTFTAPTTLNADNGAALNITGALTGTGDLTKIGGGTVVVANAASAWSGNTNVSAGTLQLGAAGAPTNLTTGAVAVASGATLSFGSDQAIAFDRTVTGAGSIAQGTAGGTTTLTGNLTGFTGTITTGSLGTASKLVVATPTAATTLRVADASNTGATQQGNGFGVLRVVTNNAMDPAGTLEIQVAQASGTGRLELGNNVTLSAATIIVAQRNNVSPSIESTDGVNTLNGTLTLNTGGSSVYLQSDAGSTFNVQGTIQPLSTAGSPRILTLMGAGNGNVQSVIQNATQLITVAKTGAGTWTLSGANTYTGSTTVNGGTLVLAPAAQASVLNAPGYASILSGKLVFDYTGNPTTPANVISLLTASATTAPAFTTGQFRTTADATHTLGYLDDPSTSHLTVKFTYFGDLNLDGVVNGDDYALIDRGFAMHATGWSNGDVNYDGVVNGADYLAMDTAFGQQNGALSPALLSQRESQFGSGYVAALTAAVPEPTSLAACGFALLPLLSRRRRNK